MVSSSTALGGGSGKQLGVGGMAGLLSFVLILFFFSRQREGDVSAGSSGDVSGWAPRLGFGGWVVHGEW
jgi:hypothetical protein